MTDKLINDDGFISDAETEALKTKDDWYPWDEATEDEFDPGCLAIEKRDELRTPLCAKKYPDALSKGFPPTGILMLPCEKVEFIRRNRHLTMLDEYADPFDEWEDVLAELEGKTYAGELQALRAELKKCAYNFVQFLYRRPIFPRLYCVLAFVYAIWITHWGIIYEKTDDIFAGGLMIFMSSSALWIFEKMLKINKEGKTDD